MASHVGCFAAIADAVPQVPAAVLRDGLPQDEMPVCKLLKLAAVCTTEGKGESSGDRRGQPP